MAEICGSATIVSGTTSITVIHGLGATPDCPLCTPKDELYGRDFWIDTVGAVSFRINISVIDFVNHSFYYYAKTQRR